MIVAHRQQCVSLKVFERSDRRRRVAEIVQASPLMRAVAEQRRRYMAATGYEANMFSNSIPIGGALWRRANEGDLVAVLAVQAMTGGRWSP